MLNNSIDEEVLSELSEIISKSKCPHSNSGDDISLDDDSPSKYVTKLDDDYKTIMLTVLEQKKAIDSVGKNLKKMYISSRREIKKLEQKIEHLKHKENKKNKNMGGLNKPYPISVKMRIFLGGDNYVSRSEVTKKIHEYITINNLRDPEKRTRFLLDTKLSTLFSLQKGENIDFFDLPSKINNHFDYNKT
jgi:chromatin remodeling complex protein RSC6